MGPVTTGADGQASSPRPVVVRLDPPTAETRRVWESALSIAGELGDDWTLIGGLMVHLLIERYGQAQSGVRATNDIDVLANTRVRPSVTQRIATKLQNLGFEIPRPTGIDSNTAYRFVRGDEIVDVLGAEGVGAPAKTVGNLQTIEIAGGSQALARSELLLVRLDDEETALNCPSLLGAILLKSRSLMSPHRDQDREDVVRLLLCVDDPTVMRSAMKNTERRWLVNAEARLALGSPELADLFSAEHIRRARATYQLLTRA